jgi:hypothetical protein
MTSFPDAASVSSLRRENVRYVIIHEDGYPDGARQQIVRQLLALGVKHVSDFKDGWSVATLMELQ